MKIGMNMLLWTADVTEEHYPLFAVLKAEGFDGVELTVPDHRDATYRAALASERAAVLRLGSNLGFDTAENEPCKACPPSAYRNCHLGNTLPKNSLTGVFFVPV